MAGKIVGKSVGKTAGGMVGKSVGKTVGNIVGKSVGKAFGKTVGNIVGKSVGKTFGKTVGNIVGKSVGKTFGRRSREWLGIRSGTRIVRTELLSRSRAIIFGWFITEYQVLVVWRLRDAFIYIIQQYDIPGKSGEHEEE